MPPGDYFSLHIFKNVNKNIKHLVFCARFVSVPPINHFSRNSIEVLSEERKPSDLENPSTSAVKDATEKDDSEMVSDFFFISNEFPIETLNVFTERNRSRRRLLRKIGRRRPERHQKHVAVSERRRRRRQCSGEMPEFHVPVLRVHHIVNYFFL